MNELRGIKTLIVTGDLDALQLVTPQTEVLFFVKGLSQTKRYTVDAVKERYGLGPEKLIAYKTLVGDTSDNLPGISGIGEKTAVMLLQKYSSLDEIFDALKHGTLEEKFAKKFEGQERTAEQMKRLVTIVRDVPMNDSIFDDAKTRDVDVDALLPVLRDFEFKTLMKRYEKNGDDAVQDVNKKEYSKNVSEKKRHASLPSSPLADLEYDRIGIFIIEKTQDLFGGSLASIAITDGRHVFARNGPNVKDLEDIVTMLNDAKHIVAHDMKLILHVFHRAGIDVTKLSNVDRFDTQVAAYLLASGNREFVYRDVVHTHLGASLPLDGAAEAMIGALLPLASILERKLEEEGMTTLTQTIEMPLIPVLFRMECAGFAVDSEELHALSKKFDERLQELTKAIHADAKKEFNINSPSQLADVLFGDLGIPTKGIKKTKSGFSTAAPELEKIAEIHPIVEKIGEYRELAKLKGTYADTLPMLVDASGRIHAKFQQCVAATGRLSGADPNLQNIPIRTELGREIRKAFIAKKGCTLVSADYSQIELRLAASIAHDQSFIRAFQDGADIHKRTAAEMWNVPEEKITKEQRYAAKAINFGILYGIGARALAKSAGVTFEDAKEFIDRYFVVHPEIHAYIDAMKMKVHTDGYVMSLYGRRRYFPEIHSGMPQLVAAAERMAMNMPIQGTQADIIKKAMIEIDRWIVEEGIDARMIAQVHDELVFEVAEDDAERLSRGVVERMKRVVNLDVPLVVDVAMNHSWGSME
jgi:DNA polymerase-1